MKLSIKYLGLLSFAGILSITACNNNAGTTSSGADSGSKNTDSGTVKTDSSHKDSSGMEANMSKVNPDQACVDLLVTKNTGEIAWLEAGVKKGTSKEVKDHAKKMLADHKKLGDKVKALIARKNLTAPPVDTTGAVTINDKKGADWDKAWVDKMVTDHSELLSKLAEEETLVKDADLKAIVTDTKPVVQSHLDMSKMMQSKMK